MLSKISKAVLVGSVGIAGLGFGAQKAAADSFSVSVHTPNVSAGYSTYGRGDHGYVQVYQSAPRPVVTYCPPPAPVYCPPPAPVVVYRPAPVHVCSYDTRPVTRYYIDCGHRVYYTEYVRYRTCDDYHRTHYRDGYYGYNDYRYNDWDHGHGHDKHGHGHDRDDDHGHGRH